MFTVLCLPVYLVSHLQSIHAVIPLTGNSKASYYASGHGNLFTSTKSAFLSTHSDACPAQPSQFDDQHVYAAKPNVEDSRGSPYSVVQHLAANQGIQAFCAIYRLHGACPHDYC